MAEKVGGGIRDAPFYENEMAPITGFVSYYDCKTGIEYAWVRKWKIAFLAETRSFR